MFARKKNQEGISEINVTPFIDVMLVLLVIFMIIIPLQTVSLPIELPASSENAELNENKSLVISINAKHELFIGDLKIPSKDIISAIFEQTKNDKSKMIFLQIDKNLPYEAVMKTLGILREGGYSNIGLVGIANENEPAD